MSQPIERPTTRYIPVPCWNQYHEWPSQSGLRYYIFHSNSNNFSSVIKRVGRRVLIDEKAFFEWVEKNGGQEHEG
jgi:hypothetical protein